MIRHPCSRREGGSRVRAGLEYSSLEAANGRSLLCRKGSGALLRAAYAFSVMVMRCWAAATGAAVTVTSEALTQISLLGEDTGTQQESCRECLWSLPGAGRNASCLQEGAVLTNYLCCQIKDLEEISRLPHLWCYRDCLDLLQDPVASRAWVQNPERK